LKTHRIYRFGPFRLDAAAKVVLKEDQPVRLARKSVETLLILVENHGQVVTKEELIATLWPDRVVDEANLAQNIAVIRKALSTEHGSAGYIETFPGRGYRVLGPVTVSDETSETPRGRRLGIGVWSWRWGLGALAVVASVAAAAWFLRPAPRPAEAGELHRVPVTRLAGKEHQPVVSPDGKEVAFVWEQEGTWTSGVWVQGAGENSPKRVSREDAVYSSPAWSPDGRRLAYLRFKQSSGAVVVTTPEGSEERAVASVFPSRYGLQNRHLDWSPDGRSLAVDDAESARQAFGIFLVSLDTGEKKRLTHPDDSIIGDVDPRYSPDGKTVSFIRVFHRAQQELFTVPAAGGTPAQLTSDGKQISGEDWTPDGKAVVFGSDRSGEFRLWKLGYPVRGNRGLEETAIYGDFPLQFSVARHAPVLVYAVLQQDLNIWRLDLAAKTGAVDRWVRIVASSGQDASPQYSPKGDRISFRSDRSGKEQLWICDSAGGNPVQITHGSLRPSVARWAPDGGGIVFNNARTGEVFVVRAGADGSWVVRSTGVNGYHPVFSPDGQWIYAGTMNSIIRIPAQGGPVSELAKLKGISLGVSADGRYVYLVRDPSGTALWRVDTRSGRAEKVLEGLVPYCSSCWALAPRGIYYLGSREGSMDRQALYFHDFSTGRDKVLVDYPEALSPIGSGPFSLSPDGRYLLCVRVDPSNADIFRVEPFR
jgi:Tol biopolymer transport system component/DNA-binding winged helix-turn-helix (wHTH) protein